MNLLHRTVLAISSLAVFKSTGCQRGGELSLLCVENYSYCNHRNNGRLHIYECTL